jgi:hypothetical protein
MLKSDLPAPTPVKYLSKAGLEHNIKLAIRFFEIENEGLMQKHDMGAYNQNVKIIAMARESLEVMSHKYVSPRKKVKKIFA